MSSRVGNDVGKNIFSASSLWKTLWTTFVQKGPKPQSIGVFTHSNRSGQRKSLLRTVFYPPQTNTATEKKAIWRAFRGVENLWSRKRPASRGITVPKPIPAGFRLWITCVLCPAHCPQSRAGEAEKPQEYE